MTTSFQNIFQIYSDIIAVDVEQYISKRKKLVLPKVPQALLVQICQKASDIFSKENVMLELDMNVVVVGDLHGHILDLFRILKHFGLPPTSNYLFLGDLVDRGEFSIETITLIFIMKILFPQNVYIIRGNHEFSEMCNCCGFFNELYRLYGSIVLESSFLRAFSYIPLSALLWRSYLCVHGGIGPSLSTLDQLKTISRPINGFNSDILLSIMWSDPDSSVHRYKPSSRGSGYLFGIEQIAEFLKNNELRMLIRGHECMNDGVTSQLSGLCTTVFSASYYCGLAPNQAGVLCVSAGPQADVVRFKAMKYFLRIYAQILPTDCKRGTLRAKEKAGLPKIPISNKQEKEDASTGRPTKPSPFSSLITNNEPGPRAMSRQTYKNSPQRFFPTPMKIVRPQGRSFSALSGKKNRLSIPCRYVY